MDRHDFEKQHERAIEQELENFLKENCDFETTIITKKFKHKTTGEIVEQVPLMEIGDYDEL